jgi:ornithine decarboxylase
LSIKEEVDKGIADFFYQYQIKNFPTQHDQENCPELRIISEPGRFFSEKTHTLVMNIIGKKIKMVSGEKIISYTLNEGVYQSFNCIIFDHQKPVLIPYNNNDTERYRSITFGNSCDAIDVVCTDVMLPELEIGDICYVESFGSYTVASSSSFNGFSVGDFYYVID